LLRANSHTMTRKREETAHDEEDDSERLQVHCFNRRVLCPIIIICRKPKWSDDFKDWKCDGNLSSPAHTIRETEVECERYYEGNENEVLGRYIVKDSCKVTVLIGRNSTFLGIIVGIPAVIIFIGLIALASYGCRRLYLCRNY